SAGGRSIGPKATRDRMTSHPDGIDRIRRLARRAEQRIRFRRALDVGAWALCAALIVAIVDVALRKVGLVGERPARGGRALAGAGVAAAAVVAWTWRLAAQAGARALDRFHGLHDRLASALSFAARHPADRTPFMDAAIEDAVRAAPATQPAKAVPIAFPP